MRPLSFRWMSMCGAGAIALAAGPAWGQTPPAADPVRAQAGPGLESVVSDNRAADAALEAGRLDEAERLAARALASVTAMAAPDTEESLRANNTLGLVAIQRGRFREAEPFMRRTVALTEQMLGPEHETARTARNNLAFLLQELGRLSEAEPIYVASLADAERARGADHPATLIAASNLATLYQEQARYDEAQTLYLRVLAGRRRQLGPAHEDTLTATNNLAALYADQGNFAEAEPLYRTALEERERTLGRDHRSTFVSLNNLAVLYRSQRRYAEAEPLVIRALEDAERIFGPEHPATLTARNNVASIIRDRGRRAEAEPLFVRVLADSERLLGPDHPGTLTAVANLANLYLDLDRLAEAEPLAVRALAGYERLRGPDHPDTLTVVNNLAVLYKMQGRYALSNPLYRRALETRQRQFGPSHPLTMIATSNVVVAGLDRPGGANVLAEARALVEGTRLRRRAVVGASQQQRVQRQREARSSYDRLALFADAAWAAAGGDRASAGGIRDEVFGVLQDAVAGAADRSVAEQAARRFVSARRPELADLMRERQQQEREWSRLDADLAAGYGAAAVDQEVAAIRAGLSAVQGRIEAIDARLAVEAPDYFALIEPAPLTAQAARALMGEDEAALLVVPSPYGTHVMAVTREGIAWHRSNRDLRDIRLAVQYLRWDAGASVDGSEQELAALRARDGQGAGRPRFERAAAYALYRELIEPVRAAIAGKSRLYVTAGDSLSGLPFSLLVTAPPQGDDDDPAALRDTRWLGDEVSLVHVPSLQSLALLRDAPEPAGGGGFFGIGDPVLVGETSARGRGTTRGLPAASRIFRTGGVRGAAPMADPAELRQMARLPGTARELEAVRIALAAPQASLLTAERATETNVRNADLSRQRVLLFSTHGLTAAEAAGIGEAGLVLTPPEEPSAQDDGFLSASEVTTLNLNADWVILSACNTATGDGRGSAGLGSLARSFFYAGARGLLASHWPVSDDVAPLLISRTLELERGGMRRADAFRQAMREVRTRADRPEWAHPFYWAPFVLIGDGGR